LSGGRAVRHYVVDRWDERFSTAVACYVRVCVLDLEP
jgi:hypothetical protein